MAGRDDAVPFLRQSAGRGREVLADGGSPSLSRAVALVRRRRAGGPGGAGGRRGGDERATLVAACAVLHGWPGGSRSKEATSNFKGSTGLFLHLGKRSSLEARGREEGQQ